MSPGRTMKLLARHCDGEFRIVIIEAVDTAMEPRKIKANGCQEAIYPAEISTVEVRHENII